MYTNSKVLPQTHPAMIRISQEIDQLLNQLEEGGIRKNELLRKTASSINNLKFNPDKVLTFIRNQWLLAKDFLQLLNYYTIKNQKTMR
ncbi:hypothetical protein J2S17_002874 [Cytobacillus purgationiresistens]|uniref:Uncharacterized protein n=2 Tax=Cytobacillus purgationiresistens TaxID=863449 RepID=A0ABU0AIA4_9BACI|nr:hypothetical protein [Cytobacillus purgationiresistens]